MRHAPKGFTPGSPGEAHSPKHEGLLSTWFFCGSNGKNMEKSQAGFPMEKSTNKESVVIGNLWSFLESSLSLEALGR